jgi:hypothetical protein
VSYGLGSIMESLETSDSSSGKEECLGRSINYLVNTDLI